MFKDISLSIAVFSLVMLGVVVLNSLAPNLFPAYIIYIVLALISFWFFSQVGFEIVSLFSTHLYIISIFLLVITLIIGQVTHGTVRWIPIGSFTLQPSEIARPFLLVFFASYLTKEKVTLKRFLKALILLIVPVVLIFIQPSLSVSILTLVGFVGVLIASDFNKKYLLYGIIILSVLIPLTWQFMAPYQRQRLTTFIDPSKDPLGAGYHSIQSVVAVGSGEFLGKGLGKGTQTQLSFLPEKQTDFVFAAVGEELGFIGTTIVLIATFIILFRLTKFAERATSPKARAYISGFFFTYLLQVFVHAGMNIGILPVTGIPYPLISAGGSSLLATMTALGIAVGANKGE